MTDRVFAIEGDWAVGTDGLQWILFRRRSRHDEPFWQPVSFVRSTRDILARCVREKGVTDDMTRRLLSGLPDSFEQWKTLHHVPERQLAPSEEPAGWRLSAGRRPNVPEGR